jgi:hypothetical protein
MRFGPGGIALLALAALAGCGGGSGGRIEGTTAGGPDDDETAIRSTLTRIATLADPALCIEAATQGYIDEAFPPAGEGALQECRRAQRPDSKLLADHVDVKEVEIDGNEATATFEPVGPHVGGAERTVSLLQDGEGVWRVDELTGAEITDRSRFLDSFRADAMYGQGGLSGEQADCLVRAVGAIPEDEIERRAVSSDPAVPTSILADCVGDGSAVGAVVELFRRYTAEDPDYSAYTACASRRLAAVLNETEARAYLAQEDRVTVAALSGKVLASCGAGQVLPGEQSVA